jgi:hypothetical protein
LDEDPEPWHVLRDVTDAETGRNSEYTLMVNGDPVDEDDQDVPVRESAFRGKGTSTMYHHDDTAPWSWLELEATVDETEMVPFGDDRLPMAQPESVWHSGSISVQRAGRWQDPVTVPIAKQDFDAKQWQQAKEGPNYLRNVPYEEITTVSVPRYRVPYFHYPIEDDEGELFRDHSGYRHHGWLGVHGRHGYVEFGPFGSRFSHLFPEARAPVAASGNLGPHAPSFERDGDGTGYLRFDGENDFVLLPPRTRMPLAGTHELQVRGAGSGQRQTLVGTFNSPYFGGLGQTQPWRLDLTAEGTPELVVMPDTGQTTRIQADGAIGENQWTHLAVVYDLREWRLYVDGTPVGVTEMAPRGEFQVATSLLLGANPGANKPPSVPSNPGTAFAGDLAAFRATCRPLEPESFLPDGP